jgi:hypothetical protein
MKYFRNVTRGGAELFNQAALAFFPCHDSKRILGNFPCREELKGKSDHAKASTDRANAPRKRWPRQTSRRLYNSPEMDHIKETMMGAGEMMQTLGGVGTVAVLALAAILAIFWLVFPFMVHNQLHRIEKQLKKANDTLESTIYYLSRIEENTKPRTDRSQKPGTETKENRP